MKKGSRFSFDGFFVGPVATAILLRYGIDLRIATALAPLVALSVSSLNFVIRLGSFGVHPFSPWQFSAILTTCTAIGGIASLLISLRLAAWTTRK